MKKRTLFWFIAALILGSLTSCKVYKNTSPDLYNNSLNLNYYSQKDSMNAAIIDGFGYTPGMYLIN